MFFTFITNVMKSSEFWQLKGEKVMNIWNCIFLDLGSLSGSTLRTQSLKKWKVIWANSKENDWAQINQDLARINPVTQIL